MTSRYWLHIEHEHWKINQVIDNQIFAILKINHHMFVFNEGANHMGNKTCLDAGNDYLSINFLHLKSDHF